MKNNEEKQHLGGCQLQKYQDWWGWGICVGIVIAGSALMVVKECLIELEECLIEVSIMLVIDPNLINGAESLTDLSLIYNWSPPMIISNFSPEVAPEPIGSIIKDLFQSRTHRKLKIDRSDFALPPSSLTRQQSQLSQQQSQSLSSEQSTDRILSASSPSIPPPLKQKLIRKQLLRHRYVRQQREMSRRYNHYLLNYLHRTNLLLIRDRIPPNLSVLETIDDGDFILNDNNTGYERKDFPHYSNVILPEHLPPDNSKVVFHRLMLKVRPEESYFHIEDHCVLKLAQVYQFVVTLFKRSIQFSKSRRGRPAGQSKGESQNHDFQAISEQLSIHFRTSKLLYDMLNSFYDFEREMVRGEDSKQRAIREIKESLQEILAPYRSNPCLHVPHSQQYISLRELRQHLITKMLEQQQGRSDD